MARIRTIKPEFWTSEQVMECSPIARLLFIGLWNFCDDTGRHPYAVKQINALIFPGDGMPPSEVDRLLQELAHHGLIAVYDVDGRRYFQVTGWHHQKIDKAQKARHPGPNSGNSGDLSPTIPGILPAGKDQGPRTKDQGMDQGPDQSEPDNGDDGRSVGLSHEFKSTLRKAVEPELQDVDDFSPIEAAFAKGATETDVLEAVRRGLAGRRQKDRAWQSWRVLTGWIDGVLKDRQARVRVPEAAHPPPDVGPKVRLLADKEFSVAHIRNLISQGKWFPATMGPKPGQPGCLVPPAVLQEIAA